MLPAATPTITANDAGIHDDRWIGGRPSVVDIRDEMTLNFTIEAAPLIYFAVSKRDQPMKRIGALIKAVAGVGEAAVRGILHQRRPQS